MLQSELLLSILALASVLALVRALSYWRDELGLALLDRFDGLNIHLQTLIGIIAIYA